MRCLANLYDFRFKCTARAGIGMHPTKASLSQLVNFKNAIWTWERYVIKFCFKLGKNATETHGMLQTDFRPSCMNRESVFEWHKRFNEGRESVRDDERCGRSKEVNISEFIGQRVRVRVTLLRFWGSLGRDSVGRCLYTWNRVSGISTRTMRQSTTPFCHRLFDKEWHQDSSHPPYSPDFSPCGFW